MNSGFTGCLRKESIIFNHSELRGVKYCPNIYQQLKILFTRSMTCSTLSIYQYERHRTAYSYNGNPVPGLCAPLSSFLHLADSLPRLLYPTPHIGQVVHRAGFDPEEESYFPLVISDFRSKVDENCIFWVITQRVVVITYRRFGTTYRSRLQK